ncbi:MAG: lysophospholipid acyltransferase family protein [Candidatus Aminicenantes bacterium]|jgi:KDO2-lipid IV(A) lauroyltransferase
MVRFKDYLELFIFQLFKSFILIFPRRLCLDWGKGMGLLFYYLDTKHRRLALSNLEMAFRKELTSSGLKRIARRTFMHFGSSLVDIIKFSSLTEKSKTALIQVEGEENLRSALQEKKGAILFTAHYGSWEIAPFVVSKLGILNVIARSLDNELLERELLKLRSNQGAKVIYKHQATKPILQSLRAKEMVAFLIDQNVQKNQAVFVDFFGRKAATTPSLAAFFLKTKSPIVPVFCSPTPSHRYHLQIFEPLKIQLEGDYNQQVLKITQICTKIIEAQIRKNPVHWFWLHNRWKTRPD